MPFGVEMLHLIGMEVVDDWWLGALVGQLAGRPVRAGDGGDDRADRPAAGLAAGGLGRGGRLPDHALGLPAGRPPLRRGAALLLSTRP